MMTPTQKTRRATCIPHRRPRMSEMGAPARARRRYQRTRSRRRATGRWWSNRIQLRVAQVGVGRNVDVVVLTESLLEVLHGKETGDCTGVVTEENTTEGRSGSNGNGGRRLPNSGRLGNGPVAAKASPTAPPAILLEEDWMGVREGERRRRESWTSLP